jgi:ssDNA-binding Zn-finger/Zn-ribbon topoisomerase 1
LKKVYKATGAEPLSRQERIQNDDWLDGLQDSTVRSKEVSGMPCPDCEGKLYLRSGKFGLFYGCENYPKTLCRGSVSADRYGAPLGVPVDAATRRVRFLLRKILELAFFKNHRTPTPVKDLTLEQCQEKLAQMCEEDPEIIEVLHSIPDHIQRTRIERIRSNRDPLDDMLGFVGVDLGDDEET